jgi:CHAT domain-containing protein/tetratricopeptide (TPR) repeat protein
MRPPIFATWICIVVGIQIVPATVAQTNSPLPSSKGTRTAAQQQRLADAERYGAQARQHELHGQLDEAVKAIKNKLAAEREVLGKENEQAVNSLWWLSEVHTKREDFPAARTAIQEVLEILSTHPDHKPWEIVNARLDLDHIDRLARMNAKQRQQLTEAHRLMEKAVRLDELGMTMQAVEVTQKALDIRKSLLGTEHRLYAEGLIYQGRWLGGLDEFDRAEALLRQALKNYQALLGEEHRDYALALNALGVLYYGQRNLVQAERFYRRSLDIRLRVLGKNHSITNDNFQQLTDVYASRAKQLYSQDDLAGARTALQKALAIEIDRRGEQHSHVNDARLALAYVERVIELSPEQRRRIDDSVDQLRQAGDSIRQKKYQAAIELAQQALDVRKELLGEDSPSSMDCLDTLAEVHQASGGYAQAEAFLGKLLQLNEKVRGSAHPAYAAILDRQARLYAEWAANLEARTELAAATKFRRKALAVRKQLHGDAHWRVTNARLALAEVERLTKLQPAQRRSLARAEELMDQVSDLKDRGRLREAIRPAQEALALYRELAGEKDRATANSLYALGFLYAELGEYAQAEPYDRQACDAFRRVLGENHPQYAGALSNLAQVYHLTGDYAEAEVHFKKVLQILKEAYGEQHIEYIRSLNNLAMLYRVMQENIQAEELLRQNLEISRSVLGEKNSVYARGLNNLAGVYVRLGEFDLAEPLFLRAGAVWKERKEYAEYARSLDNLAHMYVVRGEEGRAEELYRQAQGIFKEVLGEEHPDYAINLSDLAALYHTRGDHAQAAPLSAQVLQLTRKHLELTAAVQSERQQLAMIEAERGRLDSYLSLAPAAKLGSAQVYAHVLTWKGAVFARQRHILAGRRILQETGDAKTADLYRQLESVTRRLATLALATPNLQELETRRRNLAELTRERERLESDLAGRSKVFSRQRDVIRLTPVQLQKALPREVVLIDFLEYTHLSPSAKQIGHWRAERRLAAFLVRPNRPIEQIDLGPVQPIAAAVETWRKHFGRRLAGQDTDPGTDLRNLVWRRLENKLDGVGAVLISPDGALARVPLGALPGKKSDSYLIEDWAIAVVPVPQLLPELLRGLDGNEHPAAADEPSLLLVGDVDYGAALGKVDETQSRSAPRGTRGDLFSNFGRLPGAKAEMEAVEQSFRKQFPAGRLQPLRSGEATEERVRREAPHYRWLHLATHGFFAPAKLRSALAPGTELADERANHDLFSRLGVSGFHPGLLSGLALAGANHRGGVGEDDGILTALEVTALDLGGVELATLSACETGLGESAGGEGLLGLQRAFQVAGARTVVASLWQVPDRATRLLMERMYDNLWRKKMPRLEALREAQRWLLREVGKQPDLLRRGLDFVDDQQPGDDGRLPPFYWAAFVLSGDWR